MICINNGCTDPYFNLAAEEYLLKNFTEDIFMLWQNEPSVIVGKHQNVWAEINEKFIDDREIKIVRRYTGGGAVYHDLGNVNITFIRNSSNTDFHESTKPIQDLLQSMGIRTHVNGRGAILLDDLKISGSAQCIHQQRVLFHATLLFSSDLCEMGLALRSDETISKHAAKYVKSVRSPVVNISDYISTAMGVEEFKKIIFNYFITQNEKNKSYTLSEYDIQCISRMSKEKYATDAWNLNEK